MLQACSGRKKYRGYILPLSSPRSPEVTMFRSVFISCLILAFSFVATAQDQKLARVATLNSVQANQEFQRNVRIMRAQRLKIIELQNKKAAKAAIDAELAKLNNDNQKMFKTYGYSLLRNYTLVVEKAHVYMFVSDEEARSVDDAATPAAEGQRKLVRVSTLNSIQANQEFQRNVSVMQAKRERVIELQAKSEQGEIAAKRDLDKAMGDLNAANTKMAETYGYSLLRNYTLVVETAHVYMFVNDEEAAKIEASTAN